ncbi:hypothetical protein EDB19DRAFT_1835492 [Suillus lakei]|nr:hypothetical protein EDB19DRAFT_1835492 [Suillus lakei]
MAAEETGEEDTSGHANKQFKLHARTNRTGCENKQQGDNGMDSNGSLREERRVGERMETDDCENVEQALAEGTPGKSNLRADSDCPDYCDFNDCCPGYDCQLIIYDPIDVVWGNIFVGVWLMLMILFRLVGGNKRLTLRHARIRYFTLGEDEQSPGPLNIDRNNGVAGWIELVGRLLWLNRMTLCGRSIGRSWTPDTGKKKQFITCNLCKD